MCRACVTDGDLDVIIVDDVLPRVYKNPSQLSCAAYVNVGFLRTSGLATLHGSTMSLFDTRVSSTVPVFAAVIGSSTHSYMKHVGGLNASAVAGQYQLRVAGPTAMALSLPQLSSVALPRIVVGNSNGQPLCGEWSPPDSHRCHLCAPHVCTFARGWRGVQCLLRQRAPRRRLSPSRPPQRQRYLKHRRSRRPFP